MKKIILRTLLCLHGVVLHAQEVEKNAEERLKTFFSEYTTHAGNLGICKLDSLKIDFQRIGNE